MPARPFLRRWLKRLGLGLLGLLLLLLGFVYITSDFGAALGGRPSGDSLARMLRSPLFADGTFHNRHPVSMMSGEQRGDAWRKFISGVLERVPSTSLPLVRSAPGTLPAPPSGLRLTWFGHSAVLVEIDGLRVLTDPMWGPRASPTPYLGPARFHEPPAALDILGDLDVVLISHDHYDHLDMGSVRALMNKRAQFLVPLGVGAHLLRWGVPPERIREHDWGDETQIGPLRLIATPAQHFSGRALWDRNHTLWSSWTLIGPRHRVFFSGDTGLMDEFSDVGSKYGPFDVALLEIGAYHPSWGDIHLGPQKALIAYQRLAARRLLPTHWATFNLGVHPWSEPAETLYQAAQPAGVHLLTPQLGQAIDVNSDGKDTATGPWWREVSEAPVTPSP